MEKTDASYIVSWRNRPEVRKWLIQWKPLTIEGHLRWFAEAQVKGEVLFVAVDHESQEPVGTCALYNIHSNEGQAEWGRLCFAKKLRDRSIVRELCFLSLRAGFERCHLQKIICACAAENKPANSLYEEMGFVFVEKMKEDLDTPRGKLDVHVYQMTLEHFATVSQEWKLKLYEASSLPQWDIE